MDIKESFKTKLLDLREASGTYRAGYKYDPVEKKTAPNGTKTWDQTATKNLDKPQSAGQERGVRSLSNTLSADGKKSTSMHDVIKDKVVRPDKNDGTGGDYDVSTKKTFTSTSMKEENLNELRGKSSLSDDERKKLKDRIHKKHGKAWDDTIGIRKEKKSAGPADTRDMDKLRNRLAKMYNNLEEEQLNELKGKGSLEKIRDYHTNRRDKAKSNAEKIIGDEEVPLKTIHWNSEVGKHNAYGAKAERAKNLIRLRDKKK